MDKYILVSIMHNVNSVTPIYTLFFEKGQQTPFCQRSFSHSGDMLQNALRC